MEDYLPQVFEEFTSKRNTSIIFVSQSTFLDSPNFRRISDNSHYIICLRNKRNPSKIMSLAQQAKPCILNLFLIHTLMQQDQNLYQHLTPTTMVMDILYLTSVFNPQKFLDSEPIFFRMNWNQLLYIKSGSNYCTNVSFIKK